MEPYVDIGNLRDVIDNYNLIARTTEERTTVRDFGLDLLGELSHYDCRIIIAPNQILGYSIEDYKKSGIVNHWVDNVVGDIDDPHDLAEWKELLREHPEYWEDYLEALRKTEGVHSDLLYPDRRGEIYLEFDKKGRWDSSINEMWWYKLGAGYERSDIDFYVDVEDMDGESSRLEDVVVHEIMASRDIKVELEFPEGSYRIRDAEGQKMLFD